MAKEKKVGIMYRNILIAIAVIFILFSIAIVSAGIWIFIERNYMSSVLQSNLYNVGAILLFIVGFFVFIVSFIGCFGAYRGIRKMLFTYFGISLFLVLLALCAAFVAAAFQGEIGSIIKSNMEDTLIKRYRNNTHNNTINDVVTEAWDRMQVRLNCCAVDTEGWGIYQTSSWYQYKLHNNFEISSIELVPESCCRHPDFDWSIVINKRMCQTTQGGPPRTPIGSPNQFLNYEGCYDAAKKALSEVIWVIFGFGFVLALIIIVGMVSSICLAKKLKQARKKAAQNRSPGRRRQEYSY
ncbi:CD151 antigen-like [Watersipora subatra]|uniref:CD151 antigen-like n=1 Tax=Watersipora subatra TaxID=2589382 RepID=UPI00355B14BF